MKIPSENLTQGKNIGYKFEFRIAKQELIRKFVAYGIF